MSEERKLRPTKEGVIEHFKELEDYLSNVIEKRKKNSAPIRDLAAGLKKLKALEKESAKVMKVKKVVKSNTPRVSGFDLPVNVTPELEEFLGLEPGETTTRNEIREAIYMYVYRDPAKKLTPAAKKWTWLNDKKPYRDLRDPTSSRVIYILDKKLSKLLKVEQYKKDVQAGKYTMKKTSKIYEGKDNFVLEDDTINSHALTRLYNKLVLPSKKKTTKATPKKKKVLVEEDEDSEEEEEVPPKKKAPKKVVKKVPKKVAKKIEEEEEDEEEEDEEEEDE